MVKLIALVAMLLPLGGCALSTIPVGLPCSIGPIIGDPGASTRWTRSEKEQIVTLNESGENICHWSPPK